MEGQAEKIIKDHFHLFQQRYLQRAQPHLLHSSMRVICLPVLRVQRRLRQDKQLK